MWAVFFTDGTLFGTQFATLADVIGTLRNSFPTETIVEAQPHIYVDGLRFLYCVKTDASNPELTPEQFAELVA